MSKELLRQRYRDGLDPPAVPWTYRAAVSLGYTASKERAHGLTTHIHTVNTYMCTVYTVPPCGLSCYPRKNPPQKEDGEPRTADMLEISDRNYGMRRVRSGTSQDRYMYDPERALHIASRWQATCIIYATRLNQESDAPPHIAQPPYADHLFVETFSPASP